MMNATATNIIFQAYRDLGGLRPGQTMSTDSLNECLLQLNELVEQLAVDQLLIGLVGGTSLASFADLTTSYNLAPGFMALLRKETAVKIAPMMKIYLKIPEPLLEQLAGEAKEARAAVEGVGWS